MLPLPKPSGTRVGAGSKHRGCIARAFIEGITLEMKDILTSMLSSGQRYLPVRAMGVSKISEML